MGRHGSIVCITCKTEYDCGYGPYSSWLDTCASDPEPQAAYWRAVAKNKSLGEGYRNKAVIDVLEKHAGHELCQFSWDWCNVNKAGDLEIDAGYEPSVLIKGFSKFKKLKMDEAKP